MSERKLPLFITIDEHFPSKKLEKFLFEVKPFGIILFSRHLKNEAQTKELISFLKGLPFKPLVGIDQEGGKVNRLSSLGYNFSGAEEEKEEPKKVKATSLKMAEVLYQLGFDVNFAPVVDVGPVTEETGLKGRIYSDNEEIVTECAKNFIEGMKQFGIKCCLKHFPGLGGSKVDSHKELPFIEDEDRNKHLYPYTILKSDFIMVSHASYKFLQNQKPASINSEVYQILRELGSCDKIVTDDLKMSALRNFGNSVEVTKSALSEGCDIAMVVCPSEETLKIAREIDKWLRPKRDTRF